MDMIVDAVLSITVVLGVVYWIYKSLESLNREQKIVKECGCVCYCSNCDEPLNDTSSCITVREAVYTYTCSNCKIETTFDFGLAPVPIRVES